MSSSEFDVDGIFAGKVRRMIGSAIVAIPIQFVFFGLALIFGEGMSVLWPSFLSLNWTTDMGIHGNMLRFIEVWILGFFIYVINLVCYIVFAAARKVKLRYELLCTLVIAFIVLAISATNARGGWINLGLEQTLADAFLTSMILFAVFTLFSVVLDKFSEMKEWVKTLLSLALSLIMGSVLAFLVWMFFLDGNTLL